MATASATSLSVILVCELLLEVPPNYNLLKYIHLRAGVLLLSPQWASRNKALLLVTSASLLVTSALLVVTMFASSLVFHVNHSTFTAFLPLSDVRPDLNTRCERNNT